MQHSPSPLRRRLATSIFTGLLAALVVTGCDDGGQKEGNVVQESRSAAGYLSEARKEIAKGDVRSALIQAKNALKIDPDNVDVRLFIGNTYLDAGDAWNAEREFLRARDLNAPIEAWLTPLSRTWISLGKGEMVLNELTLPANATDHQKALLLVQQGRAHNALNRRADARSAFDEALKLSSDLPGAYIGLCRLAVGTNDLDGAKALLAKAVALAPDTADVVSLSGDIAMAQGQATEAETAYRQLTKLMPGNPVPEISLVRALILGSKIEEAEELTKKLHNLLPDLPLVSHLRALVAYMKQDYDTADKLTSKLLSNDPNNDSALLVAGAAKYALEEYEQAAKFIGGYLADNPHEERARRLYGATLYQLGKGGQAVTVLEPLAENAQDDAKILALIGAAALQAQNMEVGRIYMEKVAAIRPDDASTQAQLGSIKINLGRSEEGIENLQRAVELDPSLDTAVFTLFATLLKERKFEDAHALAQRIQNEKPKDAVGFSMQGIVHIAEGKVPDARDTFAKSLEIDPGAVDAAKNLANLELAANNLDAARDHLQQGVEHNPKNSELMMMLAKLEAQAENTDASRKWIRQAAEANPSAIEPKLSLARIQLQDNNPVKAIGIAHPILRQHPEHAGLLKVVAQAQLLAREFDNAADTLRRLVKVDPNNAHNHYLLATAYLNSKDRSRLITSLKKVVELTPMHRNSRLLLARLHIEDALFADARALYDPMKPKEGVDPELLELEAMSTLAQGKATDTISLLQTNLPQIKQPTLNLTRLLSSALWQSDRKQEAQKTLSDWLQANENDSDTRIIYATRAMDMGNKPTAIKEYRAIIEKQPTNWVVRNNLAWLLYETGELSAARTEVDMAQRHALNQPTVADTAGVIYLANNDLPNALKALRQAVQLEPAKASYRLHLAQALIKKGDGEEAKEHLQRALSSKEPFAERADAEALLKSIEE
ncbi:XrtA/PEP-CTERM system TPR-repeat protein PrsT [Magnetospira sp. QH-2]|uniref:XrtA/PEP-CTERM system TPR-repeat protein PrsT n=1 Tax=Magnetospira sp. (strain QH-2) TaxID=1288970 RepID=UPI0003E8128D|nr:XrtA/PEP-CTERM system TPR-repeat protein PrsT [Magnetospira sp. QH-2]CCQ73098.1 protein of unknown function [Magnetospira sp. QH-2]